MRIRLAVPEELDDQDRKAALDAALESVTRTNTSLIRGGHVPPAAGEIKRKRVRWEPEPPGDEHFDLPTTILQRGHGDCDDLAPWHAGSLRASGIDPEARAVVRKSGEKRWHAVVQRGDGSIEDPSAHAGMYQRQAELRGQHGGALSGVDGDYSVLGAYAAIQPPIAADGRMCLAICPSRDPRHPHVWFARVDVPDKLEPWDWSSMAASQNPAKAVLHAVRGCRSVVGADIDSADYARLAVVNDLIMGCDPSAVAEALDDLMGDEVDVDSVVGEALQSVGFLGKLFKGAGKAFISPFTATARFVKKPSLKSFGGIFTSPITEHFKAAAPIAKVLKPFSGAIRFIPGIGPVAATAVDLVANPPKNFGEALAFAAQQGAGFVPGIGPLMTGGIPGLPGMAAPLASALMKGAGASVVGEAFHAPRSHYEAGMVVRPWGPDGPAVMRF